MDRRFELHADFRPAGDQPEAIRQLIEGINAGEAGMTLLGVTGSGKSIGYDEPLYLVEAQGNRLIPRMIPVGPFIDALMAEAGALWHQAGETQLLQSKRGRHYYTAAYDPASGEVGLFSVGAFIRHAAPAQMLRVTTACGRQVTLTADHNLWVWRQGKLRLIRTEEAQGSDRLPLLPERLPGTDAWEDLDLDMQHDGPGSKRLGKVHWTHLAQIERVEYSHPYVYDLFVPGPQTFLAGSSGGVFVHNTFTIANVIQAIQRPALVLAPNKTLAAQLYGEMRGFFPKNAVEYFVSYYDYYQPEAYVPASDTYIEKDATINEHIEQMRLSATKALLERPDTIIVATVSAIYGLGDPAQYHSMVLHLVRGDTLDQRSLLRRLAGLQYTRNDLELHRAAYRVRGEIIDIFPAESEREAVRVELFDDTVESLAYFDPLTGELLRRMPRLTIYPKSHYVTQRETLLGAIEQIKVDLETRLQALRAADKLVEAQRLESRTRFDLEMMLEIGYCTGIENYSRYLSGRRPGEPPPTLFDYLPDNALLVVDESHVTIPQLGGMYRGDRSRKETLVDYGFRLPSALDNRPLRFDEFERLSPQTIYVSATPGPYELEHSGSIVEQVVRPTGLIDPEVEVRPVSAQVDDLLSEIQRRVAVRERVLVTTLTKRMAEDLTDYLAEHGIRVRYLHSDIDTVERVEILRDLRLGKFDVLVGINLLREGLDIPEVSLVAILDADKEGFLRSDRSLIQTVGRAARNIKGKAILYAEQVTGSMQRALAEMERRRHKQMDYNRLHGITPRGIQKAVADIMEGAVGSGMPSPKHRYRIAEEAPEYRDLTPEGAVQKIKRLEERMYRHARNLEFEEAARLRDKIARIRAAGLGMPGPQRDRQL